MEVGFNWEAKDPAPVAEATPNTGINVSEPIEGSVRPISLETNLGDAPAEPNVHARSLDTGLESRPIETTPLYAAPESEAMQEEEHNANVSTQDETSKEVRPAPKRAPRPSLPAQKGTTVFPVARISKIIKADSAVDICSKEATFLISAATVRGIILIQELFVKRFVEDACVNARMDKRKMATLQNEYFDFLRDVVPMPVPLSVAMEQRNEIGKDQEQDLDAEQSKQDAILESDQPLATSASPTPAESVLDPSAASLPRDLSLDRNTATPSTDPNIHQVNLPADSQEIHTLHRATSSDHQESVGMDVG